MVETMTYVRFSGNREVPASGREDFLAAMDKVLHLGGMMRLETVECGGRKVKLLDPVRVSAQLRGQVPFDWNYFEDEHYEACFDVDSLHLSSFGLSGGCEFACVLRAAYALFELYGSGVGLTYDGWDVADITDATRWVNHLMGTQFGLGVRATRLWDLVEFDALEGPNRNGPLDGDRLAQIGWFGKVTPYDPPEVIDVGCVLFGSASIAKDGVPEGGYLEVALSMREAMRSFLAEDQKNEEWASRVFRDLARVAFDTRELIAALCGGAISEVAQLSLELPARMIVCLAAELQGRDFWDDWRELRAHAYHDEVLRELEVTKPMRTWQRAVAHGLAPCDTSEYLRLDEDDLFWGTPEELQGNPRYQVSDADRLYWWDGSVEVTISPEQDLWLRRLGALYAKIMGDIEGVPPVVVDARTRARELVALLDDLDTRFGRMFAFSEMFYEFLEHATELPYRAALWLLVVMGDELAEGATAIRHLGYRWYDASRAVTFNPARLEMKRLLAVLANRPLRKRYFGF